MLKPMVKRGLFFIMEKGVDFFHNNPPKHSMAIYSCIVAKNVKIQPKMASLAEPKKWQKNLETPFEVHVSPICGEDPRKTKIPPFACGVDHRCNHQCSRIRILCFFSDFKKHDFLRFSEMTYQKVVKSLYQKFSPQSVKMSSYTSFSDHCNSIPSSRSVIHSEQSLSILVVLGCYGDL